MFLCKQKMQPQRCEVLLGYFNAKLESNNPSHKEIMGKHGLGTMNDIEEMFTNLCANNNLPIRGAIFHQKPCDLATWVSTDIRTENQIDHSCIAIQFRRNLQDVKVTGT